MIRTIAAIVVVVPLAACMAGAAIGAAGAAAGTAVHVTGAVAGATIKTTGAAVGAVTGHHAPDKQPDHHDERPS